MVSTDTALLRRWKTGRDCEAFAELVARHSGMVYRTACRVLRDTGLAEEVAQECFVALAERPAAVRHSLGGWLHALAVSRALDRLRSERSRRRREVRYATATPSLPDAAWSEVQILVEEAVAQLPDPLREAVICRYLEGHSLDDTAERLAVSRSTVQARLEKAVAAIRQFLKRQGVAVPAGTITAALGTGTAEAAPASLTAALGKLALAGTAGHSVAAGLATAGGLLMMKKALIAVGVIAVVSLGAWKLAPWPTPSMPGATSAPASVEPASSVETAQAPGPASPKKESGLSGVVARLFQGAARCSISGTVVDPKGQPLPEMLVVDYGVATASSGPGGQFELAQLRPGVHRLMVRKPVGTSAGEKDGAKERKLSLVMGGPDEGILVELKAEESRKGIRLVYDRFWTISGRVVTADGNPVCGATVRAGNSESGGSDAVSGDDGAYLLDDLAEAVYQVSARAKGFRNVVEQGVQAGRDDVDLVLEPSLVLTGRVVDADTGRPIPDFEVALQMSGPDQGELSGQLLKAFNAVHDPEGRFSLTANLAAPYVVAARARDYATEWQLLTLGRDPLLEEVVLRLPKGGSLHGFVRDTQGRPVAGARVFYGRFLGDERHMGSSVLTLEDGAFELQAFPRQSQLITAYHPDYAVGDVRVPASADLARPVEIVLTGGGTLRGTVRVAEVLEGGQTFVSIEYPNGHAPFDRGSAELPADGGSYQLERLQPGEATVGVGVYRRSPYFQTRTFRVPVVIKDGETTLLDIDLPAASGVIEGNVPVDTPALTSRDALLELQWSGPAGEELYWVRLAGDGSFRLEGVTAGNGALRVLNQRAGVTEVVRSIPLSLAEGEVWRQEIGLEATQ